MEERLIAVTILEERGLTLWGFLQCIGDSNNGNFLGLMELLSHWNPILKEHMLKVEGLQKKGKRLQVHYLSNEFQNESIAKCFDLVKQHILGEKHSAK